MVKAIPMEDWLRGCVYHDGRHGEVMLPTDKVLQIANYIQRTRRSLSDGLIDLKVKQVVDTPQTELWDKKSSDCDLWQKERTCIGCYRYDICKLADTPQTDERRCE